MEEYVKKQYLMTKISAICSVGILIVVMVSALIVVPRLLSTFKAIDTAMEKLDSVTEELGTLAESIGPSMESLQSAASGLEQMDFSNLNEAIEDLKAVVEPLSKLFGR